MLDIPRAGDHTASFIFQLIGAQSENLSNYERPFPWRRQLVSIHVALHLPKLEVPPLPWSSPVCGDNGTTIVSCDISPTVAVLHHKNH